MGPEGVRATLHQLAGIEATAIAWERAVLPSRVADYRRAHLDQLAFQGEVAWCRLFGRSDLPVRKTPIALLPRAELDPWLALAAPLEPGRLSSRGRTLLEVLEKGALFFTELEQKSRLLASDVELGLAELIAHGAVTCDSFTALRQLCVPPSKRKTTLVAPGRWSLLRAPAPDPAQDPVDERLQEEARARWLAARLLARYGILVRRVLLREKQPLPWRVLLRALRGMELRGEAYGGRFVQGFDGEQFALADAVPLLRKVQKDEARPPLQLTAADPLNLEGIVTPGARLAPRITASVVIG
jgi:ATP-dependent Lhr-like helicase